MGFPLRALVVEDSDDDVELLIWELKRGGYDVIYQNVDTPTKMESALAKASWDIVISDYEMPHFDGLAALNVLKDAQLDIPFIIVSGKIGEETAVDAMRAGANDYVMKRGLQRLVPAIQRELREAESHQERKRAEVELQRSQEIIAKAQEIAHLGSWEWDVVNNEVRWSDEVYRILGLSKDVKFSVDTMRNMVYHEDIMVFNEVITNIFKGKVSQPTEYRIIRYDGTIRLISVKTEMRYGESGELNWMLGTLQDITEFRKAQEEASRAKVLEELEKFRNALWASISHEVRTPLTTIIGMASSLVSGEVTWDEETKKDFLISINQEANRLLSIVNDVLDTSKIEAGVMQLNMQTSHIRSIFDHLTHRLASTIEDHHKLEINIAENLPIIIADELRIGQVITNLVENAVAYSPKATTITITAELDSSSMIVSVRDQGDGIPPEHLEMIFDRFYRLERGARRRRGGTGLGLSICKAIVEAHGGRIWVESEIDKGSIFRFSLSCAKT